MTEHISEDDLTLYYYGEGRRRDVIERHIDECRACTPLYAEVAGTLAMIAAAETPERGDQYGLEMWQRIRPQAANASRRVSRFAGSRGSVGLVGFRGSRSGGGAAARC